jgi:rRNA maturation endonuclease Nob1
MSIIATCGHTVQEIEDTLDIATKEWTINEDGWQKAIGYKTVCKTCYQEYKKNGALIDSEAEEFDWLHNKEED